MATTKRATKDLPFNASAEQAVLGSALISPDSLYNILASLETDDFYVEKHKIIYKAILSLFNKKTVVDVLTVTEELMNMKELENIGGVEYLSKCCDSMVALSSLDFYINIVSDQSCLRKLLLSIRDIDGTYMDSEIEDINQFVADSELKIQKATEKRRVAQFKDSKVLAGELAAKLNTPIVVGEDSCTGLTSGFPSINKYTSGFHKGDMIIVAARPSVGKTALALNMAYRAAKFKNKPVAIFSLEMSCEQLMERMLGISSRVSLNKIKTRNFTSDREKARINDSIRELSNLPIYIDDTASIKFMDVLASSRRLQSELEAKGQELGLIIVDYLGLVTLEGSKSDNRQEEVRKISLGLKSLARELKVPVIAVSQLSRSVEQRGESKKPMLSDLRDSGSIEQDADVVMLLYREDYYKNQKNGGKDLGNKKLSDMSDSERLEAMKQVGDNSGTSAIPGDVSLVEVNVAKNRNGQVGPAQLFFYKEYGRFDEPSKEWLEQARALREGNI